MLRLLCDAQHVSQYIALCPWSSGGIENMQVGKMQDTAIDTAICLAHLAVRTKLGRDTLEHYILQQRLVRASVQAFVRCFAAPGGLRHIGMCAPAAVLLTYSCMCLTMCLYHHHTN